MIHTPFIPARLTGTVIALVIGAVACGPAAPADSGSSSGTSTSAPAAAGSATTSSTPAAPAPAGPAVHDGRAVEITGDDTIKFNVTEIRATPGERLSVTLVNVGTMPKFSMGHNWLLLAGGVDPEAFVSVAAESATTDYVPASRSGDILAATKLLGPNERDTVTFNAPDTPGRYDFLCSFPGHFQVGMRGVLIVE